MSGVLVIAISRYSMQGVIMNVNLHVLWYDVEWCLNK